MREYYKKIAGRVALLVTVASIVLGVIIDELSGLGNIDLLAKIIIVGTVGFVSHLIMEWVPKLFLNEKKLSGLYLITYDDSKNNLCSIVNFEQNTSIGRYSIDIYDCY